MPLFFPPAPRACFATMRRKPAEKPATRQVMPLTPPLQTAAPPPSATPSLPPSPENAAEHFRNVNQGLPDGVRFEPLDEETMKLLRKN